MNQSASILLRKVPEITLAFWIMKICATTLGETAGDFFSMTLHLGYALTSVLLIILFLIALTLQLRAIAFHPALYWLVIVATSTAGTTMSDFMDRTLGLGYASGALLLVSLLVLVLLVWRKVTGSLSVENIRTVRAESFYWLAILISNTLGTALGDFLADDAGLGFGAGALFIGGLLILVAALYLFSGVSRVVLFWIAFVLTRPFGATFGDLLTKPLEKGGLNLGTAGSSMVLAALLIGLLIWQAISTSRSAIQKEAANLPE